jgi:LytR cell envelope-related transcriptional attenuator
MHAIESIGPVLGIVAFVGLAILAFLIFQQAREIRRLREWAGRAPERATEAADAVQAAAEASRDGEGGDGAAEEGAQLPSGGRVRSAWDRFAWAVRDRYVAIDRRLPIDGRYILALVVVAVVAAGVVTSGFGLVGGGGGAGGKDSGEKHQKLQEVAVINGTSVPGLAATVQDKVVKQAGYGAGPVGNAAASVPGTVVEYAGGQRSDAQALAKAVKPKLGETPVQPMTSDTGDVAGKAKLALLLGLDDAGFGGQE